MSSISHKKSKRDLSEDDDDEDILDEKPKKRTTTKQDVADDDSSTSASISRSSTAIMAGDPINSTPATQSLTSSGINHTSSLIVNQTLGNWKVPAEAARFQIIGIECDR